MKASDIPFGGDSSPRVTERVFSEKGEQRYVLELRPAGIVFEVDRLRRERHELIGELQVVVNGQLPDARTVGAGILSIGDMNFSSVQARNTRAKLLADRSRAADLDWYGFLEEFTLKMLAAERKGKPAVVLAEAPQEDEAEGGEAWDLDGWPILKGLPMVLFGDAGSGKSYLAIWVAAELASQGVPVLYADWEFSLREHQKRLKRLCQPMPKSLLYARCDSPLSRQADRLSRLIREHGCQYLVCDSIGFAVDGPAEAQESARTYFQALRQMGVGSLNIAHIPKQYDDTREATIFGSTFFRAGARSAWFVQAATVNPKGELRFGLHHRKTNVGDLLPSRGYKLTFTESRTTLEQIDPNTVDELAAQMPLLERMKRALKYGALSPKALAEELNVSPGSIRSILNRHKSQFTKLGAKVGVAYDGLDF